MLGMAHAAVTSATRPTSMDSSFIAYHAHRRRRSRGASWRSHPAWPRKPVIMLVDCLATAAPVRRQRRGPAKPSRCGPRTLPGGGVGMPNAAARAPAGAPGRAAIAGFRPDPGSRPSARSHRIANRDRFAAMLAARPRLTICASRSTCRPGNENWSPWFPRPNRRQNPEQLYVSVRTVRSHFDRIRDKTDHRRRADLPGWPCR